MEHPQTEDHIADCTSCQDLLDQAFENERITRRVLRGDPVVLPTSEVTIYNGRF